MGQYNKGVLGFQICCLLLALGLTTRVAAQKEPQYTQYMYNIGSFNPAYVGTVETLELVGLYRAQWIDVPGAPRTIRFGINYPFANEKHGLGFNVVNDQIGPYNQTYVDLAYSFQVQLSEETKLSFGVDAGGSFLDVDFSKGNFFDPNDPLLPQEQVNKFYPTVGAGTFLYGDNWYAGLSIPNFLTSGIYDDEVASLVEDKMQFNFVGGYVFEFSDAFKFKPAVLLNMLQGSPLSVNLSANFLVANMVTLGASYRWDNAVSGMLGFQISNSLFLGYAYDYNTNGLGEYNNGSHEAILKFYVGRKASNKPKDNQKTKGKGKQIDSPRFF